MVDDRSRIEKLVGMLGSSFDGERAAAGLMLDRAAREQRLTLIDFLKATLKITSEPKAETSDAKPAWRDDGGLLDRLAQAGRYQCALMAWEVDFVRDVSRRYAFDHHLSSKQKTTAEKIVAKARRAAMAGAEPD